MNLTEVARKLKVPTKELKEKLPELGFDIGMKAIKVPDDMAEKIIAKWNEEKKRLHFEHKYQTIESEEADKLNEKKGERIIKVSQSISVRDLAERLGLSAPVMITELMKHGIMASLSEKVDFDITSIVAESLGYKIVLADETSFDEQKQQVIQNKLKEIRARQSDKLQARPPIVVVMGHVDHGKTKLLDTIREANVIDTEAGGITQHIGAYQVVKNDRMITFIDTPGHEAFSAMRSRGANVADIAILVVAADSGIQPQTIEAIKMIQDAGLPMIVAMNKVDKEDADVEKIKKGLAEINLIPEDWGGNVICVPVSAKTGENIEGLLDMVLLTADLNQEQIMAEYESPAAGTIVESHLDKGTGPVATVLLQSGTLRVGDHVQVGNVLGKIRNLRDYQGKIIDKAGPSTPAQIIGLEDVPEVGEILEGGIDFKALRRQHNTKKYQSAEVSGKQNEDDKKNKVKKFNVLIKADVAGSLEAVVQSLRKYNGKQVVVNVVYKGLGNITEVDIVRAESTKAFMYGFNIAATPQAYEVAKEKKMEIKLYTVIYKLLEDVADELEEILDPIVTREIKGKGKVLEIFRGHKQKMIIGVRVLEGEIVAGAKLVIRRAGKIMGEGEAQQLRVGPEQMNKVPAGSECGIQYGGSMALQPNDELEFFVEKKEKQKLQPIKK
jgi:translation initiation factor IF-2